MREGGYSTIEMVECMQRERAAWDALRDRYATRLRTRESPTQVERLEAYLAENENWAEAKCAYRASMYEGGTAAGLNGEGCLEENSAEIAILLHGRVWDYDHR
ncbi:MAG: lysozyme inhibitor LprI family protein [Terricaulis sp.]